MLDKLNNKMRRKGQSTVEYIVLVTAVLGVAIAFMTNSRTGFQSKLNSTLTTTTDGMNNMAGRLIGASAPATEPASAPASAPVPAPVTP